MRPEAAGVDSTPDPQPGALRDLARLYLRLGLTAFGGPAAHIAMMEDEVVRRRGWLSRQDFLDYLGATNLIPGPNSTEMAIHVGRARGGWKGLVIAGVSFILPATILVMALAWGYARFGKLPQVGAVLYGVKPVIIAVILQALVGLGRSAIKSWFLAVVAVAAIVADVLGVSEIAVLFAGGAFVCVWYFGARKMNSRAGVAIAAGAPLSAAAGATAFGLWPLFWVFLKIGSVLFGSGYVLVAFVQAEMVTRRGWITQGQLLDAIAVGQITPGPLSTTATFIGYLLAGPVGAVVATVGIFLPSFVFVAASAPLIARLRSSEVAGGFLDGVNVASLALMAVVTAQLGAAAICDRITAVLALLSAAALLRWRVNSLWVLLAGAAIGVTAKLCHLA
jgi:chromate transporter